MTSLKLNIPSNREALQTSSNVILLRPKEHSSQSLSVPGATEEADEGPDWGAFAAGALGGAVAGFILAHAASAAANNTPAPKALSEVLDRFESLRDRIIIDRIRLIGAVDAIFACRDDRGATVIHAVTREFSDELYEAIIPAEDELVRILDDRDVEVRVRAHQGRAAEEVVPSGARCLWRR